HDLPDEDVRRLFRMVAVEVLAVESLVDGTPDRVFPANGSGDVEHAVQLLAPGILPEWLSMPPRNPVDEVRGAFVFHQPVLHLVVETRGGVVDLGALARYGHPAHSGQVAGLLFEELHGAIAIRLKFGQPR